MNPATDYASPSPTCKAIGADAGGTKLALAFTDGIRTWRARYPSVNLRTASPGHFAQQVGEHIMQAVAPMPLDQDVRLCIGAAGAGTKAVAAASAEALSSFLRIPVKQIRVTSDARIALESAFPSNPGILVIAGTGSGCYGLDERGSLLRAGGWGPGLGDPGSGTELGRAAVRRLLMDLERNDTGAFSMGIAVAMGMETPTIARVLDTYYDAEFRPSTLAPIVMDLLEAGNEAATALVEAACHELAAQCARLATYLPEGHGTRAVLAGGLSQRDSYLAAFSAALSACMPGVTVESMMSAPVEGALSYAMAMREA